MILADILLLGGTVGMVEFIDTTSKMSCFGPNTWTWSKGGKVSENEIIICDKTISNCIRFNTDTLETKDLSISNTGPRYNYGTEAIIPFGESESKLWITGKMLANIQALTI